MADLKTQVEGLAANYQSLPTEEATAQLEDVNTALETLGLEKISSLDELSSALSALESVDLSSFTLEAVTTAFGAVSGDAAAAKEKVDALKALLNAINGMATIQELYQLARAIKLVYMGIQYTLLHRPTRFVISGPSSLVATASSSNTPKHKRSKCKAIEVRYMRLVDEPVPACKEDIERRSMSYPCWGVIGHMRHYKSGKTLWIKPYKKGKERNNPKKYQPKDYEIPERGTMNEISNA